MSRAELDSVDLLGVQAAVNALGLARRISADAEARAVSITRGPRRMVADCLSGLELISSAAVGRLSPDVPADCAPELERTADGVLTGWVTWEDPEPSPPAEPDPSLLEARPVAEISHDAPEPVTGGPADASPPEEHTA